MTLTIEQRVAVARELLDGWTESEFDSLSVECRVNLVEAVEYLDYFATEYHGEGKK